MKNIVVSLLHKDASLWVKYLKQNLPDHRVYIAEKDVYDPKTIDYAVVWKPTEYFFQDLTAIKAVFNTGAGVDSLLRCTHLSSIPIIKIVPDGLKDAMLQYVLFHVLYYHRNMHVLEEAQRQKKWYPLQEPSAKAVRIGVLGLGYIGKEVARFLASMQYTVFGWSRTKKVMDGVTTFSGKDGLTSLLQKSDILISLLPLTEETRGVINRELLQYLPKTNPLQGTFFISCGRGEVQKDNDILWAVNNGVLTGATLDVFENEPLPEDSPLWSHPRIRITPHIAALNDPEISCMLIAEQITKLERGEMAENVVDFKRGY